jgi:probable FeS assembly SUF system protein SufT
MNTTLTRDVEATRIPGGEKSTLPGGTEVFITQALGGSFTVAVELSGLYRIAGADADALGKEAPATDAPSTEGPFDEQKVWEQLRNCYDPEIPVNIVDLGLIYSLDITDENGGKNVLVKMTLTAPGCGMGPSLAADAQQRIITVPGVTSANVELVWDPPWSPERISTAGREKLGMA